MRRGMWMVGAVVLLGAVTGCSSDTKSTTPTGAKENVVAPAQPFPFAPVATTTTTTGGASVQTLPPVTTSTTLLQKK